MSGSFVRGPLPLLLIVGGAFLAYKYLPVGDIVERFRQPATATPVAPTPPADPAAVSTGDEPVRPVSPPIRPSVVEQTQVNRTAPNKVEQAPEQQVATHTKPAAAPPPVVEAASPRLRILVEAETDADIGLGDYTPEAYAALLQQELLSVASVSLGRENVDVAGANMRFRDDFTAGRAGIERLCERAGAQRLLLADVSIPSDGFSTVASAFWPEARFAAINCVDGRLHKSPRKRIEPHRLDQFEYQQGFAKRAQRFVSSQAYFLRP